MAADPASPPPAPKRPARPYRIHVAFIDGTERPYEVAFHVEAEHSMTIIENSRAQREIIVPFANVKEFVVERD